MDDPKSRFTGLAQIYATARPSYPPPAIDHVIATSNILQHGLIADIGAGTGIASRLFAERGFNVLAVEPNEDMRLQGDGTGTEYGGGTVKFVNGSAEHTGLEDNSIDVVLSAQAFHWFKAEEALQEFRRILKPGGWVALIWNERDESDPLTAEYGAAIRLGTEAGKVEAKRFIAGKPLLESALFSQSTKTTYRNTQQADLDGLLNRAFSASYSPKEGPPAEELRRRLTESFQRHEKNGQVVLVYETSVYMGRKD